MSPWPSSTAYREPLSGRGHTANPLSFLHLHAAAHRPGGESGPGARPLDIAWMRSLQEQCTATGTAYFAKQLGSRPIWDGCARPGQHWPSGTRYRDNGGVWEIHLDDRKGGDPSEWPPDMRVRQIPEVPRG